MCTENGEHPDVLQPTEQFRDDENRDGSRNVGLLTIQPPDVVANLKVLWRLTDS
jgi:hypothetical protein